MLKHIVLWTLKPEAFPEGAREMKSRLEALNGRIAGLVHLEVGIDVSKTGDSADVALYSEFEDRAALDAYQTHPEHLRAAEFIAGVRQTRAVVDYEV